MSHIAQQALHKEKEEYGWGSGNTHNYCQKKEIVYSHNLSFQNVLVSYDQITEKFSLELTATAFRKARSRAKLKASLAPTSAKAPPTSEPTAPTQHNHPKGVHSGVQPELAGKFKKGMPSRVWVVSFVKRNKITINLIITLLINFNKIGLIFIIRKIT